MLDTIETLTRNLRNVSVGIAHELRGPLTRVRNRLVAIDPAGPAGLEPAIESSLAEIDATLVTFDALLKIGQIEARSQGKGFGAVDLSELLAELAEIYAPVAADRCKRLDARIAGNVVLHGDRPLLTQMISNLLENAIEHTPEGTRIMVELERRRGRVTGWSCRTTVRGSRQPKPSGSSTASTASNARTSEQGNGLGLSLVRSICGLHGFVVRLDPTASGARFEITM